MYLLNPVKSFPRVGLLFRPSSCAPRLFYVFRKGGGGVGVFATRVDDILGCGELDVPPKIRAFLDYRFGAMGAQDSSSARVGVEVPHESDLSAKQTQEEFPKKLSALPTPPEPWAACQQPSPPGAIKLRQCTLGGLCWLAAVSRPGSCARIARIASRINSLQGDNGRRIDDSVKTVQAL